MKKIEWVLTAIFLELLIFGFFALHSFTGLSAIILSGVISGIVVIGMFIDYDKKYVDAIEEYKMITDMYKIFESDGCHLSFTDCKVLFLLNEKMVKLETEFYSNFYVKDHFKDFKYMDVKLPYETILKQIEQVEE